MTNRYWWPTRVGLFEIKRHGTGWRVWFSDDVLGHYPTAQHAVDDLAGGHVPTPGANIDTAKLGLPNDAAEWDHD